MDFQTIVFTLGSRNYRVSLHARQRMAERNITHADIRNCAITGKMILEEHHKIRIKGFDIDGHELTIICVEEDGLLIITVF